MTREYQIPDTELTAVKYEGKQDEADSKKQVIYDCDGDVVTAVSPDWNEHELDIWGKAYAAGMERGERWGESAGKHKVQSDLQKALGIYERLNEAEVNIKLLASILYHHDGICKEDVAAMAGR